MSLEEDATRQLSEQVAAQADADAKRRSLTDELAAWIDKHEVEPVSIYRTWEQPSGYDYDDRYFSQEPIAHGWPFMRLALLTDRRTIIRLDISPYDIYNKAAARSLDSVRMFNSDLRNDMVAYIKAMKETGLA